MPRSFMLTFSRVAAAGAGVVVAAAIGVAGAGPASASGTQSMCVLQAVLFCADQSTPGPVEMNPVSVPPAAWFVPGRSFGQIKQDGTTNCMQLDHALSNEVIEVKCGRPGQYNYQEWEAVGLHKASDLFAYRSGWNVKSDLCLTYNGTKAVLDVQKCSQTNTYQWFVKPS